METLGFFLKGVVAGFVVAAPVGPVAALCVRRTLARGAMSGYATGLGAALADTFYGVIAAYGVTFIANLLLANEFWFRLVGGAILCVLAVKTFYTSPAAETRSNGRDTLAGDLLSALVVTGTNPITIIAFGVIFTTFGLVGPDDDFIWTEALVAGVFVGAMLWWGTLTAIATLFRAALSHSGMRWINRLSAGVIMACGMLVLISAVAPDSGVARLFDLPFV